MSRFSVRWIFYLEEDYVYNIGTYLPPDWNSDWAFVDLNGRRRLEIHANGDAVVLAGYAWDGCTPKICLADIVIGIPDGIPNMETRKPKAYYASLLHDVLYQFLDDGVPLTRSQIDRIFLDLLTRDRFAPRWLYFTAVRLLGGLFRLFTRWKRNYAGKKISLRLPPAA